MTFPMAMLRSLKPNWNSYGAPAIDERCIQKAFELWRQLSGEWQVVPCNDGGVQLERHRDGFDIEITVSPARMPETFPCLGNCGSSVPSKDAYCSACFQAERGRQREAAPAPEASFDEAFRRSPRRVQETSVEQCTCTKGERIGGWDHAIGCPLRSDPPAHDFKTPPERTVWTKSSASDPYCVHCGKTWDMHICDGRSSCPTANRGVK